MQNKTHKDSAEKKVSRDWQERKVREATIKRNRKINETSAQNAMVDFISPGTKTLPESVPCSECSKSVLHIY